MALPPSSMKQSRVAMKAKKRSKVACGPRAKSMVFKGSRERTMGGLKKDDLMLNKRGKVVSKKASAQGNRRFVNIESWLDSVMEARKALHITGFCAVNGHTLQGKALFVKTKALMKARAQGVAELIASASRIAAAPSPARQREA